MATYVNIKTDNVDKNVPTKETMDALLATKASKSHNHEANFEIYANNEMNFCTGYANANGKGDVYFNVSGATAPISKYILMNGQNKILGEIIHNNNLKAYWLNTFRSSNIGVTSIELSAGVSSAINGGYIDFHFEGVTDDYTSRIIESAKGVLELVANTRISSGHHGIGSAWGALVRNIIVSTGSLTPGTSPLSVGTIHIQYEKTDADADN